MRNMVKDEKGKDKESTALAVTLANDKALGQIFVDSGFFSDAKEQSQAVVKTLAGREVGLQPIEAMTGIHIVKGKVTLGANLMAAAVKKSEDYNYKVTDHTEERCVIEFYEHDELIGTSEFTIEDAKRAGVVKPNSGWEMYPRNMLFARAMSNGVKWYCPDVFGHAPVYVPEEMGAEVDSEGEPINVTPHNIHDESSNVPETISKPNIPEDATFIETGTEPMPEESEYECTCPDACLVHEDGQKPEPEPEEEDDDTVTVSLPDDLIDDTMEPRGALTIIMEYAMEKGISNVVRPVIVKHYPKYEDGSTYPYHIPESKVIKIVEELTGMKLKKAEKSKKCKKKDCGKRITEPEAEEQDDLCLKCWKKEND